MTYEEALQAIERQLDVFIAIKKDPDATPELIAATNEAISRLKVVLEEVCRIIDEKMEEMKSNEQ